MVGGGGWGMRLVTPEPPCSMEITGYLIAVSVLCVCSVSLHIPRDMLRANEVAMSPGRDRNSTGRLEVWCFPHMFS